jgi:MtrB/PioB family decaheme-associated outer membrane protein
MQNNFLKKLSKTAVWASSQIFFMVVLCAFGYAAESPTTEQQVEENVTVTSSVPAAPVEVAAKPTKAAASNEMEKDAGSQPAEGTEDVADSDLVYSAEASLILRAADGEEESAKYEEYRDISQEVSGDLSLEALKGQRYHIRGQATGIGQDDQYAEIDAGDYRNFDVHLSYHNFIHRYGFNARTIYSGVGSSEMTLDDALQTSVQNAPSAVDVANRLDGFISSAATGDPDVTRDTLKLGLNVFAMDPFTLKLELTNEKREGTRPFAGAFSSTEMVELFEPIDYDTLGVKLSGEYASKPVYMNFTYQFSQFTNNTDTLSFDNPLRVADAVGGPTSGRIDLAPDNQYHNLSVSGAFTHLPWNSQITASAAWGRMTQDDDLVLFTTNTAITAPALPVDSVEAEVQTALYSLRLTSRPLSSMRLKGHFRYFDYDNQTDQINFTNGYVETDANAITTSITNLPSSYTKTRAGLDVGFDVMKRTNLGVGYTFERTDRDHREADQQDDHIYKLSLDIRSLSWLEIRSSYERTDREISTYNFDVYRESGDDLDQLPQLKKYDQADMVRDRVQFQTIFYPLQALSLSGSLTYGKDDFTDSPYGLLEDTHFIFSFDADYALGERATVNLFYSFENYENTQRANDGASDWSAEGEDQVDTLGGGLTLALIRDRLDLGLTYTYSQVDGNIAFFSPSGSFVDFTAVDDTKMHTLNTKLKYHFTKNLSLSLGYLWEKFDYDDIITDGFHFVPTDASGNYQGALLSGTLPEDYDVHTVYTQFTLRYP